MNLFVFKIECPYCGNRHRTNKEGICPHCKKRYLLSRKGASHNRFAELRAKIADFAYGLKVELSDFLGHTNRRQKQLLLGMTAIMALILVMFVSAAINLATLDADIYNAPERTHIPVIYHSANTAYCLFEDGKTVELGVGNVKKFDCSANADTMFILFSGRITADVDSAKEGDYVVRIDNGKNLEIVAKGDVGKVSYLVGGDCEHLYFIVPTGAKSVGADGEIGTDQTVDKAILDAMEYYSNINNIDENSPDAEGDTTVDAADNTAEETAGEGQEQPENKATATVLSLSQLGEYSLYYSHRRSTGREIATNLTSKEMTISPNGRYLIYTQADREGSELMKYRVSKKSSEETGVKNARALSIDNKGRFFTYVKTNPEGDTVLSYCRNANDKLSYTLPDKAAQEIIFSADMHSFAIRYPDRTVFKSKNDSVFRVVNFDTASDFGYRRNAFLSNVFKDGDDIAAKFSVLDGDLFPFFYYDASGKTIYRVLDNGSKSPYLDVAIEDAAVSENGVLAYVSDGVLYMGKLSKGRNVKRALKTNFAYDLYDISPDGKTLFICDTKTNRYMTLPSNAGEATEPEFLTENTSFIKCSQDSKMLFFTKDSEAYLKRSAGTARLTDNNIIPRDTCVFTTDFSQFVYARDMGSDTKGNRKISLYIYREGKPMFVTENLTGFITAEGRGFTDNRTAHIFPDGRAEVSGDTNGTMIIK